MRSTTLNPAAFAVTGPSCELVTASAAPAEAVEVPLEAGSVVQLWYARVADDEIHVVSSLPTVLPAASDEPDAEPEPEPELVEVSPEAVTFADEDGTEDDSYTVPAVEGVQYLVDGEVVEAGTYAGVGTVTVTAEALDGFVLAEGAAAEWSHEFSTEGGEPEPEPEDRRSAEFHLSNTWSGSTDVHFMYGRWVDEVFIGDW